MRFTVIKEDGTVYKDGKAFHNIDLSFLPANVRAIQWNVDHGELEFSDGTPNQPITDLTPFQQALTAWQAAQDAANAPPPPPTPEQLAAQAQAAKDAADALAAKQDAKLAAFAAMTPAEVRSWVGAHVTTLADAKDALATLAVAVSVLARKL